MDITYRIDETLERFKKKMNDEEKPVTFEYADFIFILGALAVLQDGGSEMLTIHRENDA